MLHKTSTEVHKSRIFQVPKVLSAQQLSSTVKFSVHACSVKLIYISSRLNM